MTRYLIVLMLSLSISCVTEQDSSEFNIIQKDILQLPTNQLSFNHGDFDSVLKEWSKYPYLKQGECIVVVQNENLLIKKGTQVLFSCNFTDQKTIDCISKKRIPQAKRDIEDIIDNLIVKK